MDTTQQGYRSTSPDQPSYNPSNPQLRSPRIGAVPFSYVKPPAVTRIDMTSIADELPEEPDYAEYETAAPATFEVPSRALPRPPASPRAQAQQTQQPQPFAIPSPRRPAPPSPRAVVPQPISQQSPPSPRLPPLYYGNSPPQQISPVASPRSNPSVLAASAPSLLTAQTASPSLQRKPLPKPPSSSSSRSATPTASPITTERPTNPLSHSVSVISHPRPKNALSSSSSSSWGTVRPIGSKLPPPGTSLPPPIDTSSSPFGSHRSPREMAETSEKGGSLRASPIPSPVPSPRSPRVLPPSPSSFKAPSSLPLASVPFSASHYAPASSSLPSYSDQDGYYCETSSSPRAQQTESPQETIRRRRIDLIAEIVRSESEFSRDMSVLHRLYMEPVSRRSDLLAPELVRSLFSNVDALIPLSQQISQALEQEAKKQEQAEDQIGGVFLQYADFLRVFKLYCSNLPSAITMYRRMQSPQWTKFLQERKNDPNTRGVDLETFLILPFQHICRYPTNLRSLLELTAPSHCDYAQMEKALEKLITLVEQVKMYGAEDLRDKKETELETEEEETNKDFCKDVQDSNAVVRLRYYFTFYSDTHFVLVTPTRRLVRTGPVRVWHQTSNYLRKVPKPGKRELWLFNDLIIVAKHSKKKIKEKGLFPLEKLIMWDLPDSEKATHAFNFIRNDVPEKICIAEKTSWMKEITDVLASHSSLLKTRPASVSSDRDRH